ncbi:hypothetical protein H8711_13815 [Clostridiaceae bacterium NSJ-31]|uniref:Uncharacterized protein n=1 Tax=Ligaoa zhengdingensis TaxID=2763658 RepID=A0A926I1E7_9FIRM|nr:hypothetical protein [Ligaoa zhengdingensis]MBC8547982.1 hypothetical protein [Ligaoa zhengdingensis]
MGITTAEAIAVGITAVPTPISDDQWDGWLYHRFFSLVSPSVMNGGAAKDTDGVTGVSAAVRFEVDSKAMRKLPENMAVFVVFQVTEVGIATMQFHFNSRILLKLP